MSGKEFDRSEICYLALQRPALKWGVPFGGLALNAVFTFFAGAELQAPVWYRSPMMFWLMGIPIHMALKRLTAWDYHWAHILVRWTLCLSMPMLGALSLRRARSGEDISSSV